MESVKIYTKISVSRNDETRKEGMKEYRYRIGTSAKTE
jgi:hypothetical protein